MNNLRSSTLSTYLLPAMMLNFLWGPFDQCGIWTLNVTTPGQYSGFCYSDFGESFQFSVTTAVPGEAVPLEMRANARLEGAVEQSSPAYMQYQLASAQLIPCSDPYTDMGLLATMGPAVATDCGDLFIQKKVVDWVQVQLWSASDPTELVASANGLLRFDHAITSTDGVSPLTMSAQPGDYRVRVVHRNHLPRFSDQAYPFRGAPINFGFNNGIILGFVPELGSSCNGAVLLGQYPCTCIGGPCDLIPGNALSTTPERILYVGPDNDRDAILVRIGGNTPSNVVSGYYTEDVNLDGMVKYLGPNNDRDIILQQLNGVPTGVIVGQ